MKLTAVVKHVTGRTTHRIGVPGGAATPLPTAVRVEIVPDGDGFQLVRFATADVFAGDTWHDTMVAAMEQAAFEYEIGTDDWSPA